MANKVVQLVDKNSNNLYPIAGSVITDAVSTTAISNQAVTNPKIENGAVNGVANDATAIGTAKLALDTVGTPNLRDESVTSDKIDWTTIGSDYSDNEQKTAQKWFNQPIYKKTIVLTPLPNNGARDYPHGISNYDRTCKIEAMMVDTGLNTTWALPYEFVKNVNVNRTNIQIVTGLDLSSYSGIVTLYYTKSS